MTEAEWLGQPDLVSLEKFILQGGGEKRRLRLLACACVRADWEIASEGAREAIQAAEAYADGSLPKGALNLAGDAARRDYMGFNRGTKRQIVAMRAATVTNPNVQGALRGVLCVGIYREPALQRRRAKLVLDVYGNPFRPVTFAPEWRTSTAVAIARQMYKTHDFSAMPILADALQDAGCDSADVLDHCRDPKGVHVRGCWVVDSVLGKG